MKTVYETISESVAKERHKIRDYDRLVAENLRFKTTLEKIANNVVIGREDSALYYRTIARQTLNPQAEVDL